MAGWRLRQSYGFGAARLPLAPVFAPGPFSVRESAGAALAGLADELAALDKRPLLRGAAGALSLAIGVAVTVFVFAPQEQELRDEALPEIVLIEPAPEELLPEPEPEPLVEPEPEPLPLAEAQPEPAPEALVEPAAPQPPAKPEPLRAEPVRPVPAPTPKLRIDAVAKAPEPAPLTPPRVVRAEAPKRVAAAFKIDPVAPSFAVAASAPPASEAAPLRAVSRAPARTAPPKLAFSLDPVVADAALEAKAPPPALRAEPRAAPVRVASAKPLAMPRFDAAPPPARYAEAPAEAPPPPVQRVAPSAARQSASPPAPAKAFQGVPLGSLAACVSDREEDALKLELMAAAGARSDCASRAGRYRLVETKNLNAFLMWIERNPSRKPADRCVELRLALECLAGTPNPRTDNG